MDREAVHGCAPLGGSGRQGPGAVGGDGARAPSTEGAVALRAVAGAASGSLHSAQRTAGSAAVGGRALRRSDCPASSPHRFAPASSTCAAGMDSPCNSIFLGLRMAVMESARHAAVGGCAAGGRTMKGRGARETLSFGAARPRPGRQGPAGHSRAGAATVEGTPRHRTRPGDTPWRRAPKRGAVAGSVRSAQRAAVSAAVGGRALRRSDYPAPSPHRFAPASSTCAAGMDSPCNSIFLGLRMAVMESVRHAAVGGRAAGGRTMKGRGARETLSFGAAWPRAGRPVPAGHSRAGAATVEGTLRYRKRPGDTPWRRAPKRGAASGSVHSAQRTAGSAAVGGRALRRSDCRASSPPRFAPASSACAAGMDSPCNSIFLRLRMAVMESVRHAAVGGCAAGGRTMKGRGARETLSFGAAWPRPGRQGAARHSRAGAATVGGTPRYRKRPGDTLDYLVGYGLSPVLWRKLPGRRSAGRVQSVALLLICEGEAEIEAFAPRAYWTVTGTATATDGATLASGGTSGSGAPFRAELCRLDGAAIDVRRSDCRASSPPRFAPASSTCAAGMDSPCNSIFRRPRIAVMEWVRHAAVGRCAAGGRTMKGRGARETLSFGAAWPRPGRQGPAGHSRAGAATVGGTPRYRKRSGDTPWRRAPKRGGGRLAGGKRGPGGARRVRSGGLEAIKREKTIDWGEIRVLRAGSGRCRLTRDNCC